MTATPDPYVPLLHEDLVTPVHHHDESRNHLLVRTADGHQVMSPAAAARHVAAERPDRCPHEVAEASGWRGPVARRTVLQGAALGFGALLAESAAPRYAFGATATSRDLLVVVFMRGGADGLSLVPPVADPAYLAARPRTRVTATEALALDGRHGLHPGLPHLKSMYDARQLAVVVGAGNPGVTRSHFEDMASMEWAAPASMRSGWLARHLMTSSAGTGTVRAITRGPQVTMSLSTTAFETAAVAKLASFGLHPTYTTDGVTQPRVRSIVDDLYRRAGGRTAEVGRAVLDSVARLSDLAATAGNRAPLADGYTSPFVEGMRDIATVARGGKGLEVACIDIEDWDMHRDLGVVGDRQSWMWRRATDLDRGLEVLRTELGDRWATTTVVTMSEFGRRVQENGDLGLDHGHGNVMLVAGGGINGGKVYGSVPSLTAGNLVQGDVPITTDYRQVLSEIVTARLLNGGSLGQIFPGFTPGTPLGLA